MDGRERGPADCSSSGRWGPRQGCKGWHIGTALIGWGEVPVSSVLAVAGGIV